jgi:hypothetical protein
MAFPKRIDANQNEIVKALRNMGASVWITSALGQGAPDFVVGLRSLNILVELKDGKKRPSQRKLTPSEERFHNEWKGRIEIITSMEEAIALVNGLGR